MKSEEILRKGIQQAIQHLYGIHLAVEDIVLQSTRKEFEGSHTFVSFPITRFSKKSPEQTATEIGQEVTKQVADIEKFSVVKGFLNFSFTDRYWIQSLSSILSTPAYGEGNPIEGRILVEYSSPNTNKPLHLGHLRNNFLGYSVAEILKAAGYTVVKNNLVNDRGIHICKSMLAYQKFGKEETPESSGLKGDHLVGKYYVVFDKALKAAQQEMLGRGFSEDEAEKQNPLLLEAQEMLQKWEHGDPDTVALWKKMNGWVYEGFAQTYHTMGVDFDKTYYESDTYLLGKTVVEEGLQKGVFFKKENNSVWVDLTDVKLDEKLLLRADGTSVYITQDLGTADLKYKDFSFTQSIYVVGNEQDYHFNVLKAVLKKLGRPYAEGIFHLSYGMVDLPTGKMKSREGTVVDADDLMAEMLQTAEQTTRELGKLDDFASEEATQLYRMLGMGALKYFLLKVDPKKRMLFQPEESIQFQGNTGPFIQYTHARIQAILRKATAQGMSSHPMESVELLPVEKDIILQLDRYPATVQEAAREYSPAVIANYVFDLAKEYNRFYQEVSIFNEKDPSLLSLRIALSAATAGVLKSGMKLLGIDVPKRM